MLMVICLLGLTQASFAQTKDEIAAQRVSSMEQVVAASKTAGLDEKQIQKVKEIIQNLYKKQDDIKADTTLTAEDRTKKLKDANAEKDWKVRNIMGDKYLAYADARKKMVADAAAKKP